MGETKDFILEIKNVDEDQYVIEGLASVYDVKDLQDDVVEKGAFTRTLSHKKGVVPLLWAHDRTMPIGKAVLTDQPEGLWLRGELNAKVEKAREALALAKQGVATGLSIGYDTVQSERGKDGSRHLKEIKLYEVSQVVFQACPEAVIYSAKNEDEKLTGDEPVEIKSGRTLSAKTRASMMAAIQALQELMASTDLEDDPAPEEIELSTATPFKANEAEDTELAEMVAMCRKWRETIR